MVDFTVSWRDRHHRTGVNGIRQSRGLLQSPPLTLSDLDSGLEAPNRTRRSPLRFQDSLPEDLKCFDPTYPCCIVDGVGAVNAKWKEPLRFARRLCYDLSDSGRSPFTNSEEVPGPYDRLIARRRRSLSHLPDACQADVPPCLFPKGLEWGQSDVNLTACLLDSGKKRAQLVDHLKEAHQLLEGQSEQLRKRNGQLLESKAKIELLSAKQKQLENSISQLEGEKNMLEMSRLEDQKRGGVLQDKVLHLEAEMAKTKSSLDLISSSHGPSPPPLSFPSAKLEDGALKQDGLLRELQSVRDTLRIYQERVRSLEEERDKAREDLRSFEEAQHLTLMTTNQANQRLNDSLRAQTGLHDEVNQLRLKYSEVSLERGVLSSKSVRLEETVANLRTQLTTATADKDRLLQEKLELHKQVRHLTLELERTLKGKEGFDEQVADLHMELVSTKSQANRQDQEKVLLQEKLATIKQVNDRLTSELGESRQRLGLCQDQLHQLQAEKTIFSNQIEALQMERSHLVSQKEMLLTAVQAEDKMHLDELHTLRRNCKELRASEAELKENRGRLEVELQQKAEELTAVTLEQHQIAQYWKGKWQETVAALNAKEKELRLAIVKHSQKNEKADSPGDCESFAADLEELFELRATVTRVTAENVQLKKQQEESERIIHLLQLQRDIASDTTLQGSLKVSSNLENLHTELQKSHDRIHELEKEKIEMETELKKLKSESTPLARVELDACKQELELEKSRSQKLQHQIYELKRTAELVELYQSSQATTMHKLYRSQIARIDGNSDDLDPNCNCYKHDDGDGDRILCEDQLSVGSDENEEPCNHHSNQKTTNSPSALLPQDLQSKISSLQQELKDAKVIQRQQNAIIQGLKEELEEAKLSKPGEIKASLEEVDSELFLVREELQKVWDMLHARNSELEEQHQELESARGQYTECSSENQRLELLVTSLKQEIAEKEQALRQIERLRKTEKTELEIKISSLELKLAEVEVLGELHQQKGLNEESEKHQSSPIRKCARCDSFMEEMSSKLQDYGTRNSELQAQRDTTLKSLNEVQVLTKGLQETLTFEQQLSQTLQKENNSFSKRSQEMTEQLATLVKEQEDLTKAYSKLPENKKGNASIDYWMPRSHLVQNVVDMVKSQEEQKLHLEEENRRLKEDPGFQSFQKLEKEIQSLQQHLDAKTEKMTAMACEMEALRHKNECLMTANMKDWQQVQSLREQSHDSVIAAILGAVPRPSDGQHCNPWATHLFQELQPDHQGGREPSPCQMGGLTSPTATPRGKDGQRYSGCSLPDHGAPRTEAWFSGMSTRLHKQSKQAHSGDRHSPALTQRRTPSPPRPNCPDPPLNASKSPRDFTSASESQTEDEKSQGKVMTPEMKCSLLLSPRPFRLHRSNRNKK
ncbi:trichohyalin-like isoform X2 [Stegostoma tigrinum]|uniref:trichohyalin-like isoform X2 n=1 Tax=Stegostoma tigrinum TaxID=3053191 RepID=UPI00202AFD40|nr:trichohyalin-like isoform X2 [Stegostoma tigrinum]